MMPVVGSVFNERPNSSLGYGIIPIKSDSLWASCQADRSSALR